MPRQKRLEDELRAVWTEWSAPPEYGLWHERKEPTVLDTAEEAVGLAEHEVPAPQPVVIAPIPETPNTVVVPVAHSSGAGGVHLEEKPRGRSPKASGVPRSVSQPPRKRRAVSVAKEVILGRPNGNRAMIRKGLTSALGVAGSALGTVTSLAGKVAGNVYNHVTKSRESSVERPAKKPEEVLAPGVRMTAGGYFYIGNKRISREDAFKKNT